MNPLTVGKKKKDGAIAKGAKIGAGIGASRQATGNIMAAKALGMGNKAALGLGAAGAIGGAIKGAVVGAGLGAGVKAIKNKKKNFNSDILTEFKKAIETDIVGQFPKSETKKTKKKKSVVEQATDTVKNKDNVPENIKSGLGTKFLMKK